MQLLVSACIVVKDEPLLAQAVASVRPFVHEVCILDSSTDPELTALAMSLADKYEREDEGIQDWSVLRNRNFAMASHPFVLWLDADDEVLGLEHLAEAMVGLYEQANSRTFDEGGLLLCPYEYAFDEEERCVQRQRRERLVYRPHLFAWEHPAHETLTAGGKPYVYAIEDRIVWRHRRETKSSSGRALRILDAYAAAHPEKVWGIPGDSPAGALADPWLLANLAYEYRAAGRLKGARDYFQRYVATEGDKEPRALAHVALCDLAIGRLDIRAAIREADEALILAPWLLQTGYAVARARFLFLVLKATTDEASRALILRETIDILERALVTRAKTSHGVNPRDAYEAHGLAATLWELAGRRYQALRHIEKQLQLEPKDPPVLLRQRDLQDDSQLGLPEGALDVVIVCGDSLKDWNPRLVERGADVYGSELAVIAIAKRLARWHRVRVYNRCGTPGVYDGVEYRDWKTLPEDGHCDVLVGWRDARTLETFRARARLLWVHDKEAFALTPARALQADAILALSDWHRQHLMKEHGLAGGHVYTTRNGVDVQTVIAASSAASMGGFVGDETPRRHSHRAIYSSSPDRGLLLLLDLWPRIRAQVPDAELRVFYGHAQWKETALKTPGQTAAYVVARLEQLLAETPGVTLCGRVPPQELAREMAAAGVWAYPTWFEETSCMSAMEAQAAGCRVVTTRRAALAETVIAGTLLDGDPLTKAYQDEFVAAVVDEMRHGNDRRAWDAENGVESPIEHFDWNGVAREWNLLFRAALERADAGMLPPYEPHPATLAAEAAEAA